MTQQLAIGLGLVLAAGFLQGSFMLPMTLTRRWQWEHGWAMFSLLGMLLFNVALAACAVPHLFSAYLATPAGDLCVLAMFGALWGAARFCSDSAWPDSAWPSATRSSWD